MEPKDVIQVGDTVVVAGGTAPRMTVVVGPNLSGWTVCRWDAGEPGNAPGFNEYRAAIPTAILRVVARAPARDDTAGQSCGAPEKSCEKSCEKPDRPDPIITYLGAAQMFDDAVDTLQACWDAIPWGVSTAGLMPPHEMLHNYATPG